MIFRASVGLLDGIDEAQAIDGSTSLVLDQRSLTPTSAATASTMVMSRSVLAGMEFR